MTASLSWRFGLFLAVCVVPVARAGCGVEYAACVAKAQGISSEIQACQSAEESHRASNLEAAYRTVLKKLSPERRKELQQVQRAWSQYRLASTRFYVSDGLSGQKIQATDAWLHITCARISELEQIQE